MRINLNLLFHGGYSIIHSNGKGTDMEERKASCTGPGGETPPAAGADGKAHRHTHRHQNTKTVKNRLARIVGHLHAVERMIDDGRDCSEVLIQLAAVRSALNNVCKIILKDHMDHCMVDAVLSGDQETLRELDRAIDLLMK